MNIYVIRHGMTNTNASKLINGRNDEDINEIGISQAKEASKIISNKKIDIIICSPIYRAVHTANIVNVNNVEVIYDERLEERDSSSMMYKPVSVLDEKTWYDCNSEIVYNDSEGFKSILKRVEELVYDIKKEYADKNVLLVTHGDVCKAINCIINNVYNNIEKFDQGNCEIVCYQIF